MPAKSATTIQGEIATAQAALEALRDSMEAMSDIGEDGQVLSDTWQFARSMAFDARRYAERLANYSEQTGVRWKEA